MMAANGFLDTITGKVDTNGYDTDDRPSPITALANAITKETEISNGRVADPIPGDANNEVNGTATVNGSKGDTITPNYTVSQKVEAPKGVAGKEVARNGDDQQNPLVLPGVLLFGTKEEPDKYHIPKQVLQKLPPNALSIFLEDGEVIGSHDYLVCRMGATESVDSFFRMKQYLEHGDYVPFTSVQPLQVIDKQGKTVELSALLDKSEGARSTEETFALFLAEMKLYAFAMDCQYDELRTVSSRRLQTRYPVYAREILAMLEHLYQVVKDAGKDEDLIKFINDAAYRNREELVRQPHFFDMLRGSVSYANHVGSLLLEVHIEATKKQEADLFLSQALVKRDDSTSQLPPQPPQQETAAAPIHRPNTNLLTTLHDALGDQRLVVAKSTGYGTLLGAAGKYVRNKDFTFQEGELLLADYSRYAFNGKKNIMVENAKGERGDVLGNLMVVVPETLGTKWPVHACRPPAMDREMRTFSSSSKRSRSRSPMRRFSYEYSLVD